MHNKLKYQQLIFHNKFKAFKNIKGVPGSGVDIKILLIFIIPIINIAKFQKT